MRFLLKSKAQKLFQSRRLAYLIVVFLFIWGFLICLRYGRIGFMPLDQSIVFDGGWRIISGEVPFRDFQTPNGLTPIYFQFLFFLVFGVNWLAYCLHAAVFNGLFCALAYGVLRLLGGAKWLSLVYAILSGVVFYPPFGVPYMDQHAFFFVFLTLFIILKAHRSQNPSAKTWCWICAPLTMVLAYFSKQIPTIFAVVFLGILLLLTTPKNQVLRMILTCLASSLGALLVIIALAYSAGMEFEQIKTSMFYWPGKNGLDRFRSITFKYTNWQILKGMFYPLSSIPMAVKLRFFNVVNLTALIMLCVAFFHRKFVDVQRKSSFLPPVLNCLFVTYALLLTCNLFVLFTLNQGENGLPYIFVCLGAMHLAILMAWSSMAISRKYRFVKYAFSVLFICVALSDAFQFNDEINRKRWVHELELEPQPIHFEKMPEGLEFMDFHLSPGYRYIYSRLALMDAVDYLRKRNSNFYLVGDTAVIYGLTRRPSLNPSLWYHPGLTMPPLDTKEFRQYENRVIANIRRYKARYLVLEGMGTWFSVSVDSFKDLGSMIIHDSPDNRTFRQIKIFRIDYNKQ